jgi:murein DD-endopeptidase MepM/ murein hydrolase activator NlpD
MPRRCISTAAITANGFFPTEQGQSEPEVAVQHTLLGAAVELTASNEFYAPVELKLKIKDIQGLRYPDTADNLRWVLPPRSETVLLRLDRLDTGLPPLLEDPDAKHSPAYPYRVPVAVASNHRISQAYPDVMTHTYPDSYYAVDMAMPIGTDIFAARAGIVFSIASNNYRAGADEQRDGSAANVVRILHADGTYAIYAHLNRSTIRVEPGDKVQRGEYIADSGNTGFSSGPHLHFAVLRNAGMRIESVPFTFQGANASVLMPATGMVLTAY